MAKFKIIWTNQAKVEVKKIYEYFKEKSPQRVKNVRSDLLVIEHFFQIFVSYRTSSSINIFDI